MYETGFAIATFFVPGPGELEAVGVGARAVKQGVTVLGHHREYLEKAAELGARRFNVPMKIWEGMTDTERWAANQKVSRSRNCTRRQDRSCYEGRGGTCRQLFRERVEIPAVARIRP